MAALTSFKRIAFTHTTATNHLDLETRSCSPYQTACLRCHELSAEYDHLPVAVCFHESVSGAAGTWNIQPGGDLVEYRAGYQSSALQVQVFHSILSLKCSQLTKTALSPAYSNQILMGF